MAEHEAPSDQERRARAAEVDRDRWRTRALDGERRYREREVALRMLRAEVEELRADRDAWRRQADRLMGPPDPVEPRREEAGERMRAVARRTARAAWEILPEPGRRIARPLVTRVRERVHGHPNGVMPADVPATADPAGTGAAPDGSAAPESASGGGLEGVAATVSVVIPTFNAGPEFKRTLDAIGMQEGVGEVELLVVDSGSTDGTPAMARAAGARVVEIRPEEFSHGGTRDRAADLASGDVLVMTVQDAVLAGPHALRNLVRHLCGDEGLAAVSARQIPRVDCDLFGAFLLFAHARGTLAAGTRAGAAWFPSLGVAERRAACALDDVCAAIRRTAWESVRFRDVAFGEDLDFGVRAVEQGWRVEGCPDAAVVHSHRRDAVYHLRRFAVDRMSVSALLGDPDANPAAAAGLEAVATAAVALLGEVETARAVAVQEGAGGGHERGRAGRAHERERPGRNHEMTGADHERAGADHEVAFGPYLEAVASALGVPAPRADEQGTEVSPRGMVLSGELAAMRDLLGDVPALGDPATVEALRLGLESLLHAPLVKEFAHLHPCVDRPSAEAFVAGATALVVGQTLGESMRDESFETPLSTRLRAGV